MLRLLTSYRVSPQELEFQETLIAEREAEIRDIESGIHELNDIFRDLGTIVEQQGGLIGESAMFQDAIGRVHSDDQS
jgi:syntaxin 7